MDNAEERAYRFIINEIVYGGYSPGDFLREMDLAPKLNMSRTPVNKALGRLVSEGFLDKMPKKGCYIPIPTPKDAELVFSARQIAEGDAASLAAQKATNEEILKLKEILSEDIKAFENNDRSEWANINEKLHLSISKFGHNKYIEHWVRNIFWRSNIYIFFFDGFYRPSNEPIIHETPQQHIDIVDAIARRDNNLAQKLMSQHVLTTFSKLIIR